ncbi:MAG: GspE/PulE family protein [Patescibacteria group bacterium]
MTNTDDTNDQSYASISDFKVAAKDTEDKFSEKMEEIHLKEKERLTRQEADTLGLSYINLTGFPIGPETISTIDRRDAKDLQAICFLKSGREIRIATTQPQHARLAEVIDKIKERFSANIEIYLISDHSFNQAVKLYDRIPQRKEVISGIKLTEDDVNSFKEEVGAEFKDITSKIIHTPLSKIVSMLIAGAVNLDASDIHIEAEEKDVKVRYRIDGILHDIATLPHDYWSKVVNRIKLLAGLKINIEREPQDGRVKLNIADDKIDVRVSTLPTAFGESVVMRLLRSKTKGLNFNDLGLRGDAMEKLNKQIGRPNGLILTTGPTGSGKTTTLYAVLTKLNNPETKIITLEDPIEYELEGINQSQVDPRKKYDFATGLKSIMRQNPDIIMVGEIRDAETATTAIQAALTGHLVLSTLHTNDAAGVVPRLMAMDVKPFLLAPAINAAMAQRLVRKICEHCKEKTDIDGTAMERIKNLLGALPEKSGAKVELTQSLVFYQGKGCPQCHQLGYKGRVGIFEIIVMDPAIEKAVLANQVSEYGMRELAQKQGMVTMVQDGLLKALDGITTVDEVFRAAE